MKKVYNKLVRAKIPEIIEKSGKEFSYKIVSDEEYEKALKEKLIEEAIEVSKANRSNIVEELADVLEIVEAFKVLYSISDFELKSEM